MNGSFKASRAVTHQIGSHDEGAIGPSSITRFLSSARDQQHVRKAHLVLLFCSLIAAAVFQSARDAGLAMHA